MTPPTGDDQEVQRMLALKRHEQPPPAFFRGFSEKVLEGIQSAEPPPKLTLRQRLSVEFYGVPIYICIAGVIVCGLLVVGLIGSLRVDPAEAADGTAGNSLGAPPTHALVPPRQKPNLKAGSTETEPGQGSEGTGTVFIGSEGTDSGTKKNRTGE